MAKHSMQAVDAGPATHNQARRLAVGIVYILASAMCFGSMPIFARLALGEGVDVSTLMLLRFTLAAVCMWAICLGRRLALPRGRALLMLVAMGAVGCAGEAMCYFHAITLASVGLVSLLLYLYPALVAILSWMVLGQHPTGVQVAAVAIALVGSALTIGQCGDGKLAGILLGLLAAAINSVYVLVGSRIPATVSPSATTAVITTAAAAACGGAASAHGLHLPTSPFGWGAVLAVAGVGGVLAILCFFQGLGRVGPVRASVFSTVEPLCSVGLGALLLGETITPMRAVGGAFIFTSVFLLAWEGLRTASEGGPGGSTGQGAGGVRLKGGRVRLFRTGG